RPSEMPAWNRRSPLAIATTKAAAMSTRLGIRRFDTVPVRDRISQTASSSGTAYQRPRKRSAPSLFMAALLADHVPGEDPAPDAHQQAVASEPKEPDRDDRRVHEVEADIVFRRDDEIAEAAARVLHFRRDHDDEGKRQPDAQAGKHLR